MTDSPGGKNEPEPSRERHPTATLPPAWVTFLVVLTAEYLALSYAIDAQDLLRPAGLDVWLGRIGSVAPLAFVVVAATLAIGSHSARGALERLGRYGSTLLSGSIWGAAHVALLVACLVLIRHLTGDWVGLSTGALRGWIAVWFAIVVGLVVSLGNALWPWQRLRGAITSAGPSVGIGIAVGVVAWLSGLLSRVLWGPLARLTLELVHALLTLIASDPVAAPEAALVGTERFYVEVAPVCSGVEGIGLMLGFMGAYLYLQRHQLRWPRSFLLLPLSAVVIWVLNVIRITALIAVGTWGSAAVALGGFHSKAGWVFFTLGALGFVVIARRSVWFRRTDLSIASRSPEEAPRSTPLSRRHGTTRGGMPPGVREPKPDPVRAPSTGADDETRALTAAYLVPMLAVLAVTLVMGLATAGFDSYYPLRVLVAAAALWYFRHRYPPLRVQSPWLGLGAGLLLAAGWLWGFQREGGGAESPVTAALAAMPPSVAAAWIAMRVLGSIVTVPIAEELAFRGYLMRRLVARDFHLVSLQRLSWPALLLSSLGFGLLHSQWLLGTVSGLVFGLLAVWRGRLADAVYAHSASNAGIAVYVLVTGDWVLLG